MPPGAIHLALYVSLFVFLFNSQACAQRLLNQNHHASRRVPARIVTVRPTSAQSTKPSQNNSVKKPPLTAVHEPRGVPPKEPEGCQKATAFAILFGVICCLGSVAIFVAVLLLLKLQNTLKHYKQQADMIAAEIDKKSRKLNGTEKSPRKKYHPSVAAASGSTKTSSSPKNDAKKGRKKKKNLHCKGKNSSTKSGSTGQEIERKTESKKTPRKERRAQKSPKIKDTPSKDEFSSLAMDISKTQSMPSGGGKAPDSKKPVDKKGPPAGKSGGTLALRTVPSDKTFGLSEDLTGSTTRRTLSTDSQNEQTLPPPPSQ